MSNTKTFFDNDVTLCLDDKSFILTRGAGEDYKSSYATLVDSLKVDILRPFLKSTIGRLYMNNLNRVRDSKKWNDEYFEYLLLDGRELDIADYPELAGSLGIVHRSGKFVLPNFRDGTVRNIEAGSGRALGSFQDDAMQVIKGEFLARSGLYSGDGSGVGAFSKYDNTGVGSLYQDGGELQGTPGYTFDSSRVVRTAEETRMKNVGVQFYIIAKVII